MKIIFFSPYQYIGVHAIPEAIVAKELQKNGHEVVQITCDGLYDKYCISMSAAGIWPNASNAEKAKVCAECKSNRNSILRKFLFTSKSIEHYIDSDDQEEIEKIISGINVNNWTSFSYDGIPLGRYAAYEFLLNYKINNVNFSKDQWDIYFIHFKNAAKTLVAAKKMFLDLKPDRLVVYNNFYSANHIMCAVAEQFGVSGFSLHAGSHHLHRLSQMTIFKGWIPQSLLNKHDGWREYSKLPLSKNDITLAFQHIRELLTAKSPWVYSVKYQGTSTAKLKEFFGIKRNQKVLLATMASGDERFAATLVDGFPEIHQPIFSSQDDWIKFIVQWVAGRPDLFLIIRVHPREFPNKRESVTSEQAVALAKFFEYLPKNVVVNWPSDSVSLHDLIRITDVGLNATSTAGLELLMFGVPVVIYDVEQLFSYPAELNLCAKDRDDYIKKIELAISRGWSLDSIYDVYKWLSFKSSVVPVDISDAYAPIRRNIYTRVVGRLRKILGISDPLPGLKKGEIALRNAQWLTYAIENNVESHIGDYLKSQVSAEEKEGDTESNKKDIKKITLRILKKISNGDVEFLSKINALQ